MDSTAPTPRELTLDEALTFAILLQKNDRLTEARELLRRVLEARPDHARALHYAGVLAHQEHRHDEAILLIERSLALDGHQADWHNNFGIVLQERDRFEAASAAYRRAIELDPDHANAHNNLGVLLRATGHPVDAETEYRTAIRLNPEYIDAYKNLGILLNGLGRTQEAAASYCKAITLQPRDRDARKLLALAHCTLGEIDEAARIYQEWLDEEPDDPIAAHMLAACTGHDVPSRASNAFVTRTFDGFAASFDSRLALLSYRAPALVGAMLEHAGIARRGALNVLDAGCGTGLCGAIVAGYASRLTGVDLSEGMLTHARGKKVYHELVQAELCEYMVQHRNEFELIVSADTLVYFGDLHKVIVAAAGALRPGGLLVFTLEHARSAPRALDYRLQPHGRYSHEATYVDRVLRGAGLTPEIGSAELRLEGGVPVAGLVIRGTKRAPSFEAG